MAVTLTNADLTQPDGELYAALFPGDSLETLLAGWLGQAETLVEGNVAIAAANHNAAAAAWVYHRAYTYVANRLASSPSNVIVDGTVTKATATDQRAYFVNLAAAKLADYEGYETEGSSTTAVAPAFFGRVRAARTTVCSVL